MSLPHICLLSPIRESVPAPAEMARMSFVIDYTRRGGRVTYRSNWRNSSLAVARNALVEAALATDAEVFFFADADMVFTIEDMNTLLGLELGEDIVSGMFKKRNPDNRALWVGEVLDEPHVGSLIPMRRIGFGLVMIPRSTLAKLRDEFGAGLFEFRWSAAEGEVVGEDYIFCDKLRAIGGRIWAHKGVRLGHVGPHIFV